MIVEANKLAVVTAAVFVGLAVAPASAQTLREALASAYMNNSSLLSQREVVRQTVEEVPQALGGWRPTVSMAGDSGVSQNRLNTRQPSERVLRPRSYGASVSQNLFNGLQTLAGTDKAELDYLKAKSDLAAKEQDTLVSAVTVYMNVVRDQATLDLNRNNEEVLERQLAATRDRFRVGDITRTDVSQSESRLAAAVAARVAAEAALRQSRASYLTVVGQPAGTLSAPTAPEDLPASRDETLARARANHPDVTSAQYTEQAAQQAVKSVRGQLLPSVDLVGSVDRLYNNTATGSLQTSEALTLELTVPIYERGVTYSQLRAAKLSAGKSRIDTLTAQQSVIEAADIAWEALAAARAQIASFKEQIDAAQIALAGVRSEASVGQRTVLDVLNAEQELLTAQVSLVQSQRDEIVAAYQLKESVGEMTAQQLQLPVAVYDPDDYYRRTRNKWIGSSTD